MNLLKDKSEYMVLDFFKVFLSFLVVAIHLTPFAQINSEFSFWFGQVFSRVAVPIFFITSGYFGSRSIKDKDKFLRHIHRIVLMYIVYSLLYLPQILIGYISEGLSFGDIALRLVRNYFINGTLQLWYFVGLLVAFVLAYFVTQKLKVSNKVLVPLIIVLYTIGVFGDAYSNLLSGFSGINQFLQLHNMVFYSTRNGLFFGFPMVCIGYLLSENSHRIRLRPVIYAICAVSAFLIMNIEEYWIKSLTNHKEQNMIFLTPVVAIFAFLCLCSVKLPKKNLQFAYDARKLSVIIFGFHLFISFYITNFIANFNNLELYIIVLVVNILLGLLVIKLQKKKKFDFLKYLF